MPQVTLVDGTTIECRQLGLFELDHITPDRIGPFTYTDTIMGKEYEIEFDPSRYETPPTKPTKPEALYEEGEWNPWADYKLYHAALWHEKKRTEEVTRYYERVGLYILENCVDPEDHARITNQENWDRVCLAVMIPQLTMDLLGHTLKTVYRATFDGLDVFEALNKLERGRGSYNTIRAWEIELMTKLGLSELEYAMLPLEERARKVCGLFLPAVMENLEAHARNEESKLKSGRR